MSLIIYDWDCTLYPYHYVLHNGYDKPNAEIDDTVFLTKMQQLEDIVTHLLTKTRALGHNFIVTYGPHNSIQDKCYKHFSKQFRSFLDRNALFTTCLRYEYSDRELKEKTMVDMMSFENIDRVCIIGDGHHEHAAGVNFRKYLQNTYNRQIELKRIKMKSACTIDEIIIELTNINNNIEAIVMKHGDVEVLENALLLPNYQF